MLAGFGPQPFEVNNVQNLSYYFLLFYQRTTTEPHGWCELLKSMSLRWKCIIKINTQERTKHYKIKGLGPWAL